MICVAASPSIDTSFEIDRLTPGRIHRPREHVRVAGGKALNVARSARRLGARPLAVALLAEHGRAWITERLEDEGIELITHPVPGEVRHCLSVLDAEAGDLTEFYEGASPVQPADWEAFVRLAVAQCEPGRWFALSGSLPAGVDLSAYTELMREAAASGALTALDASGPALGPALEAGPDLVKVNEQEARELLGGPAGDGETLALEAALALRERAGGGERVAIVTRGEQGAALVGPEDLILRAGPLAPAPFPVGSGDAFMAGLLAGHERGLDWPGAFGLALGAGAANAECPGPGVFDPARADALAGEVELEAE